MPLNTRNQHTIRWMAFLLIATFMMWGPFYRQVLGGRNPFFRNWVMFTSFGYNVCSVRYVHVTPHGEETLDLGTVFNPDVAYRTRRLKTAEDAFAVGKLICQKYGIGADIRLYGKHSTPKGWGSFTNADENLCYEFDASFK